MGFITQAEYSKIYNSIKQSTTSSSTPSVLILLALDVDAICACKMLTVNPTPLQDRLLMVDVVEE
jgi:hypothetical protein